MNNFAVLRIEHVRQMFYLLAIYPVLQKLLNLLYVNWVSKAILKGGVDQRELICKKVLVLQRTQV